jgi:hypothetical protein
MGGASSINGREVLERRPLARSQHSCEDNIKMDLKETKCEGVEYIQI